MEFFWTMNPSESDLKVEEGYDLAGQVIGLAMKVHRTLVNYLVAIEVDEGLLINFGAPSLEFKKKFRIYRKPGGTVPF